MSDNAENSAQHSAAEHAKSDQSRLPEVQVQSSRAISILWFIPLLAILLGFWLVYQHFSQLGPVVTITFETATGLEANKTKIKYKDVDIGEVENVELSDDLSTIRVTANLKKSMEPYVTEKSRFWVVRPRVGASGISGLTTLVSGAYIAFDPGGGPGDDDEPGVYFKGLEDPPITSANAPGLQLTLVTGKAGSLGVGSPIFFNQFQVGQVESRQLSLDDSQFEIGIFIDAPYHHLVNHDTRFWNASGIDISLTADGFSARSESMEALLLGGIAFDSIATTGPTKPVKNGTVFMLHDDYASINEAAFTDRVTFVMHFKDSIRGLQAGAPVEFRGVKIGRVKEVNLVYDNKIAEVRIPVLVELEPERITILNTEAGSETTPKQALSTLVLSGLRAQLETASLLTGQLFVALDMHPDAKPATIFQQGTYPEFPTVPSEFTQLTDGINTALNTVNTLPLQDLLDNINNTVTGINQFINAEGTQAMPAQLSQLLEKVQTLSDTVDDELGKLSWSVRTTLKTGREALAGVKPDAPMYYELTRSLRELTQAARKIRVLVDQLNRQPESVLVGKQKKP